MKHEILDGGELDLSGLPQDDVEFLLDLRRRAENDEDYFGLDRRVSGPRAYPLKGSDRVTREIHDTPLFLVAEDIVDRAGIRQGVLAPDRGDEFHEPRA